MIERRIVRRYATALFNAASASSVIDQVESDLGLISYSVESSPRIMGAMSSPVVPAQTKREIIRDIFGGKIHEITLSYLYLLIDKRREEAITQTEEEFILLANEARGIVTAEVITAVAMDEALSAAMKAKLGLLTGKSVILAESVDPRIMGGAIVRIGDRVIDGSVKGQLAALRENLLS